MKMTIFVRILIATLLPVLLVLIIVVGTARTVIQMDGTAYAQEITSLAAKQISEQTALRLENIAVLQNQFSQEMANIDYGTPEAKYTIDGLLAALIISNRDLYSTWFAFEPGVFTEDGRYYKTLLRKDGEVIEVYDMSDEQLSDPEASPWYNIPLATGQVFANIFDYYDFSVGEGAIHGFTMTYPIITSDGSIIGCVGLDIRYEDLFSLGSFANDEMQRLMLVSEDMQILFSTDEDDIGNSLLNYGFQSIDSVSQAIRDKAVWQEEIISPHTGDQLLACLYPITIEHTGQTVYLYRDAAINTLYSSFYPSMEIVITTGVFGMILLAFCVYFSTRGIVRHVKRITDSFYNVANNSAESTLEGEHIPIEQTNVAELDVLQSALVKMMMQLRDAHGHRLKALEAEMEREKLIASTEAKTNFFASMSHEIRTPMNAVIGISEIMLHEGGLSQTQEKHVQDIKVSADFLLSIINDILDISKLETGKMELHPEHYNFRTLMDNITSLSTSLAAEANLRFIFEHDGELPLCLYGDGIRLRQVLLNLVGNAVKFTKEGYVMLRVLLQEDVMRFDVVDTGIGIREDEIVFIFDTFKRIDTKRNREVRGTGLGLPISKSLVDIMGGTITVESVYGKGSTFSVIIPMVFGDERKLQQDKTHTGIRFSNSLRVLIVDDDKTNLSVSSGLMKVAYGIRCDTAASGHDAVSKVRENDYDIIFMDHMMPELDGVDTTQIIRQLGEKYKHIPIIALTANAMAGTRDKLINNGMDDFLTKPIQSYKLREMLNKWVPEEKRLMGQAEEPESQKLESTQMSDLSLRELLENEGVDTITGMENVGYDEEMYIRSLRILKESLPQSISLIGELLEQGNTRELHIRAHGLKGSLASVGAANLSAEAKRLEAAALEDNTEACRTLLLLLADKLRRLIETLDGALPGTEHLERDISGEDREAGIRKLCSALERYDYEAIIKEMNAVMTMKCHPETLGILTRAKLLIDSFEYDEAAALIRGIATEAASGED